MTKQDPRISRMLMSLTYLAGGAGLFVGYGTIGYADPTLSLAALIAVGLTGFLSWLRHSVFYQSDAKRMGWDLGRRNNFQIEVGLANLAWGLLAVLAVVLDWGLRAESASFLAFGFYLLSVAVMLVITPSGERTRPWTNVLLMVTFGGALTVLGFLGMAA